MVLKTLSLSTSCYLPASCCSARGGSSTAPDCGASGSRPKMRLSKSPRRPLRRSGQPVPRQAGAQLTARRHELASMLAKHSSGRIALTFTGCPVRQLAPFFGVCLHGSGTPVSGTINVWCNAHPENPTAPLQLAHDVRIPAIWQNWKSRAVGQIRHSSPGCSFPAQLRMFTDGDGGRRDSGPGLS